MELPLKITYLPRISENIRFAQATFNNAMERFKYNGKYTYCYCTKSSHYDFVLEEALNNDVHIETSSAYDIPIVRTMYERRKITKETFILCNGFKMPSTNSTSPNYSTMDSIAYLFLII
jgi:arginine decarboxylase